MVAAFEACWASAAVVEAMACQAGESGMAAEIWAATSAAGDLTRMWVPRDVARPWISHWSSPLGVTMRT